MFEPEVEENAEVAVPIVLDLLLQIPRAEGGVADTAAAQQVLLRVELPPGYPLESPPSVQLVSDNTLPASATAAGQGAVEAEVAVRFHGQSPPAQRAQFLLTRCGAARGCARPELSRACASCSAGRQQHFPES